MGQLNEYDQTQIPKQLQINESVLFLPLFFSFNLLGLNFVSMKLKKGRGGEGEEEEVGGEIFD